ncbi:alpha/beta hydrolase family protein [Loktanella sp. S4079]|uniref:alpha/beta hydrolase family protein n=1 Tax=Loktanella sp. S4079 TaxID=579483 RepID=UPI0005F9C333|nr:alpha/beta hydrolase [Loktanella sp. S4079]KJZ18448.1 hypothetical protein TW80_13440 [Loktanella sp. S4079]
MILRHILVVGIGLPLTGALILWRLADHDLEHRLSEAFAVTVSGDQLTGTLWLPDDNATAVVAFVHGDGPQDRTMAGGYAPMINALLDRGIAVASWDKPGVGSSEGNWLDQSMSDRVVETQGVLQFLKGRFEGPAIGALGFSQAGWVLPNLTDDDVDFLILIGAAVSWKDQGVYFTKARLRAEGYGAQEIEAVLAEQGRENARAFGRDATVDDAPAGMTPDRWRFIHQNQNANARRALSVLGPPLLALWGAEDLNVDPKANAAIYAELLDGQDTSTRIAILPNATHGLLKAPTYNWQLTKDWSPYAVARFLVEGRHAFAPGALETIADWIENRSVTP